LRGEQEVARALRRGVARFETTRSASQWAPRAKRARIAAKTPEIVARNGPNEGISVRIDGDADELRRELRTASAEVKAVG
jgi:hypothetical protein